MLGHQSSDVNQSYNISKISPALS